MDEFLKECAIVNPHLQLYYRVIMLKDKEWASAEGEAGVGMPWTTFFRAVKKVPEPSREIMPHPHGVELGILMQMLKDTDARTLRAALTQDFSRVSS